MLNKLILCFLCFLCFSLFHGNYSIAQINIASEASITNPQGNRITVSYRPGTAAITSTINISVNSLSNLTDGQTGTNESLEVGFNSSITHEGISGQGGSYRFDFGINLVQIDSIIIHQTQGTRRGPTPVGVRARMGNTGSFDTLLSNQNSGVNNTLINSASSATSFGNIDTIGSTDNRNRFFISDDFFRQIDIYLVRTNGNFLVISEIEIIGTLFPVAFPGAVSENLLSWYSSDFGTFTNTNLTTMTTAGNDLVAWQDRAMNHPVTQTSTSIQANVTSESDFINFNPLINFNRGDYYTVDANLDGTGNNADLTDISDSLSFEVFGVGFSSGTAARKSFLFFGGGSGTNEGYDFELRDNNNMAISDGGGINNAALPSSFLNSDPNELHIYNWQHSTGGDLDNIVFTVDGITTSSTSSTNGTDVTDVTGNQLVIGAAEFNNTFGILYDGDIGEVVIYSDTLSDNDRQKIVTAFALKYGITLTSDYISGNNTVWDIGNSGGFDNRIIGLVRNDSAALNQKISQTNSSTPILTIALQNDFSNSNNSISRTEELGDQEYLLVGDNDAATSMEESNTNLNPIVTYRLSRMWKWNKTDISSSTNSVFMLFNMNEFQNIYNKPFLSASDYTLILSPSNNFSGTLKTFTAISILNDSLVFEVPINSIDNDDIMTIGINPFGPGGEVNNLQVWLRADNLTFSDSIGNTAIDTGDLRTWLDLSGNDNNMVQATSSRRPTLVNENFSDSNLNYNPIVNFDGQDFLLVDENLDGTTGDGDLTGLSGASDWDIFVVAFASGTISDRKVLTSFGTGTDQGYTFEISSTNTVAIRDNSGSYITTATNEFNGIANSRIFGFTHANNSSINSIIKRTEFDTNIFFSTGSSDTTLVSGTNISVGVNYITNTQAQIYNGSIAEIIIYNTEKNGSRERSRILSYLGLKYGITLTQDYYNSIDTLVWDIGNTGGFDTRIFGIARDDNSGLNQKISRTNQVNPIITVALEQDIRLPNNSSSRTNQLNDLGFLIWGDNNEDLNIVQSESGIDNISTYRLNRYWRVEKNNVNSTNQNLYLFVNLSTLEIPNKSRLASADYSLIFNDSQNLTGSSTSFAGAQLSGDTLTFIIPIDSIQNNDYMSLGVSPIAPGNQLENLILWLRADIGTYDDLEATSEITSGDVQTWRDLSTIGNNSSQDSSTFRPTLVNTSDFVNFNPSIEFDGDDFFLVDRNLDGTSGDANLTGVLDSSDWELFVVGFTSSTSTTQKALFSFGTGTNSAYIFNLEGSSTSAIRDNSGRFITTTLNNIDGRNNIEIYGWAHENNASLNEIVVRTGADTSVELNQGSGDDVTNVSGSSIGIGVNASSGTTSFFEGNIAEVIFYNEEKNGTLERERIITYLALKYGITLSDDYYGGITQIWDVGNTGGFDNRIFGLAREDSSGFSQKIAQTIETGGILSIALQNDFASSNNSTTRTIELEDGGYLLFGDNNNSTQMINANANLSPTVSHHLSRMWAISKNGITASNTIYIQFDLTPINTIYNKGTFSASDYTLILTNTVDFSGTINTISGSTLSGDSLLTFAVPLSSINNNDLMTFGINAIAPGGEFTDLKLWLKADDQTFSNLEGTTAIGSGSLQAWRDFGIDNNNLTQDTSGFRPTLVNSNNSINNLNYNPIVRFNNDYMLVNRFLDSTTSNGDLSGISDSSNWDLFVVGHATQQNSNLKTLFSFGSGANTAYSFDLFNTSNAAIRNDSANYTATINGNVSGRVNAQIYGWQHNNGDSIGGIIQRTGYDTSAFFSQTNGNNVINITGNSIAIGTDFKSGISSNNFIGDIAEIIMYSSVKNGTLEREKIISYLALKYGLTLTDNYYSSDGTSIWDVGNTDGFDNRIFGIARDDDSGLNQKIAYSSVDNTSALRIALVNNFSLPNTSNSRTEQLVNEGYLLIGDNDGELNFIEANSNINTNYSFQTERTWRISKTDIPSTSQNMFIQLNINNFTNVYNRSILEASDYTLILSSSNSFSGSITTISGSSSTSDEIIFTVPLDSIDDDDYMLFAINPIGPGGQVSNLHMWYRADEATFSDLEGENRIFSGRLNTWRDIGGSNNNISQNTSSRQPSLNNSSSLMNYNPIVSFNVNDQLLVDRDLDATPNDANLTGLRGSSDWELFVVAFSDNNSNANKTFLSFGRGTDNGYSFDVSETNIMGIRDNNGNYETATGGNIMGLENTEIYGWAHGINDPINEIITRTGYDTSVFRSEGSGNDTTLVSGNHLSVGVSTLTGSGSSFLSGDIAEIILFSTEKNGTLERERIISYLAAKYGITLSDDYYISSSNTAIRDIGGFSGYDFDIFMLIRDDASNLHQKVSTSINSNSILTISLDNDFTRSNTNSQRTSVLSNNTYMTCGSNNGELSFSQPPNGSNDSVSAVLSRYWAITESGNVAGSNGNLYLQFDINDIPLPTQAALTLSDFRLLISTSSDLTNSSTIIYPESFTSNNLIFEVPETSLENLNYFTIGLSIPGPGALPTDLILWLKSDNNTFTDVAGTTPTSLGSDVLAWRDNSIYNNHVTQATTSNAPSITSTSENEFLNGYPTLIFDGDDFLSVNTNLDGTTGDGDITGITNADDWHVFVVAYTDNNDSTKDALLTFGNNQNDSTYSFSLLKEDQIEVNDGNGFNRDEKSVIGNFVNKENVKIFNWEHSLNLDLSTILSEINNLSNNDVTTNNGDDTTFIDGNNIDIGAENFGSITNNFNGSIAEIIIYNDTLSTDEKNLVNSYLSIKYGIRTDADYYLGSTLIWNQGNTGGFDNDIAGLLRQDLAELDQKVAFSSERNDILTASLLLDFNSPNNASTRTESLNNNTYFLWGHNNGDLTITNITDADTNLNDRVSSLLDRVWLVSEGGDAQNSNGNLYLQFDLTDVANTLSNAGPEDYNLFISDSDEFSTSSTFLEAISLDSTGTAIDTTGQIIFNKIVFEVPENLIEDGDYFTFGFDSSLALPVELSLFKVQLIHNNHVRVIWETSSETNSSHFIVQRSENGKQWSPLKKVLAQGFNNQLHYYETNDFNPFHGISYYRLKQIDTDGYFNYSNTLSVKIKEQNFVSTLHIYPNPSSNIVCIENNFHSLRNAEFKIKNSLGQIQNTKIKNINENKITLDVEHLSIGLYYFEIKTDQYIITKNIAIIRK